MGAADLYTYHSVIYRAQFALFVPSIPGLNPVLFNNCP